MVTMTELVKTEIDIKEYIKLYNSGVSLSVFPANTKDVNFTIFQSAPEDTHLIDRDKNYKLLFPLAGIKNFVNYDECKKFYMLPIRTCRGTIVGFIFRSYIGKQYASIYKSFKSKTSKVPIMYGWYKSFANYDKHKKCMPIVVCEGAKDCIALKKIYPFVLANNTSSLGLNIPILRNISNKFILCYDNDDTGRESILNDKKELRNLGCYVDSVVVKNHKDAAEAYYDKSTFYILRENLLKSIKVLMQSD